VKRSDWLFLGLLLVAITIANTAFGQTQIQGLITGRNGAQMMVKTQDGGSAVVVLTPGTQVEEIEGRLSLRKKSLGLTALIPGLAVQVKGSMNQNNQIVADEVRFKASDLKTAQETQAGLAPVQAQANANSAQLATDQQQLTADQQQIAATQAAEQANAAKIAANKAAIAAANKRFGELGQYNILDEVTVYFANGKVTIDPQYKPQLIALAQKAQGITAFIIQVQGYASAVGSAAVNQKLSQERADNVLDFLEQQGGVPLTNVLAPGAMGTTDQVAENKTAEGQAENRRVVVRVLQNKGIAGT
jgi:outer membrane protein OmpA-like peptidoglycan-associated protein